MDHSTALGRTLMNAIDALDAYKDQVSPMPWSHASMQEGGKSYHKKALLFYKITSLEKSLYHIHDQAIDLLTRMGEFQSVGYDWIRYAEQRRAELMDNSHQGIDSEIDYCFDSLNEIIDEESIGTIVPSTLRWATRLIQFRGMQPDAISARRSSARSFGDYTELNFLAENAFFVLATDFYSSMNFAYVIRQGVIDTHEGGRDSAFYMILHQRLHNFVHGRWRRVALKDLRTMN